jgi:hypothetical protein
MKANVIVAAIGASAAILGALAGGGFTYLATVKAQEAENERAEMRLDVEARGAARALIGEFAIALSFTEVTLETGKFLTIRPVFAIEISPADLKLIHSRLTSKEYESVGGALASVTLGETLSRAAKAGTRIPLNIRRTYESNADWLRQSIRALRRVADVKGDVPVL